VLVPIVKDLNLIAMITAIGLLYAIGFLLTESRGVLSTESHRIKALAVLASMVWVVTVIGGIFTEVANLLGAGLLDAFNTEVIRDYLFGTGLGRNQLFQLIAGIMTIVLIARAKKVGSIYFALALTMAAILLPLFSSHEASAGSHGLAIGSLLFHVGAVSLWLGGVIGLMAITPQERVLSITRFSRMALWCAIIVGVSGGAIAWTQLHFLQGWFSRYGALVLIKIALFAILVGMGARHRRFIARGLSGAHQVLRLLINEAVILIAAVGIGGWLSTTEPPKSPAAIKAAADPVLAITGIAMPPRPTLWRILTAYVPDGTILGILILLVALYVTGVLVLSRRGDSWPVGRTIAFALAISAVDFATSGGLGVYAHFAFSYHMIAHMVLGMIAPIGFVLSAPITLALRTLPQGRGGDERGIRGTLIRIIHSKYSVIMTNPVIALVLFDGSLFALYLTPLFGNLMRSHNGHLVMDLHFLLAGYLFFYMIVGIDPNPKKIPHIVRIIVLFAAMSIHAFFSIALLSTSTEIDGGYFASLHRPWNINVLTDQHTGGAIGWAMGEIPILLALIATFIQWMREDSREARRIDRAADRAAATGEEDELARYNKYLAKLAEAERKRSPD
jgi:putative copper resistance protein D